LRQFCTPKIWLLRNGFIAMPWVCKSSDEEIWLWFSVVAMEFY